MFLPYMGMAAILINGAKPFEQIVNIPSTEGPVGNLVKIGQAVSERNMFHDFIPVYSPWARVDNPGEGITTLIIHCKF